jgi:hypothetical protein
LAEWLVEHGVGESRALLVEGDDVMAAKMRWPDELFAGKPVAVQLVSKPSGAQRGLAVDETGNEILVDGVPAQFTEGQRLVVRITRAPMAERGRLKRAQARAETEGARLVPGDIFVLGDTVRSFPSGLWEDVWQTAVAGEIAFPGGALLFSVAPAMTVVDIDGDLPPHALSLAAVPALARGLSLFDLGGSIGVDFPTLAKKEDRRAVDDALAEALADWPHERTAMNGFGFVQLVARLEGPSLLHRAAFHRAGMAARALLRRAERLEGAGAILLAGHPALEVQLKPEWLAELARRTGREVRWEARPTLALEAPQAQLVPR